MLEKAGDWNAIILDYATRFGIKVVAAIALWIVGGIVINLIGKLTHRSMEARKVDATLIRYTEATMRVVMRIALVIAILSVLGIETTSFAALLAAAGIAIGAAWSGLLANFAAGTFLIILRPFKVGDFVCAGGVTGDVIEIGLFATTITTPDNLRVTVGNNKIFSDNIINYTAHPYRRVELVCQLAHSVDPLDAIARFKVALPRIANVVTDPAPDCEVLEFNNYGTKLAVRPYCHNRHYWQVYFDTNKTILAVCAAAGWPAPAVRQVNLENLR
jgi:small conductance mechanosensitive channel